MLAVFLPAWAHSHGKEQSEAGLQIQMVCSMYSG